MKITENIAYGIYGEELLDVYAPEEKAEKVFLYFHGGGFKRGDKSTALKFAKYLTDRGIALISANYRMFPNAKYPDFINDAADAVAFSKKYARETLGCDTLYVGGSSAGGYLTMMLCFDPTYMNAVGLDNSAVAGYFHDAGQPTAHFNVLEDAGIDPRRVIVDETAPLYYMGTSESYPPMRFIVSDNDMKNRYEQTMLVLSTLKHFEYENFDHVVMHGKHCAYVHAFDENGDSVLGKMICDFIKKTEEYKKAEV